LNTYGPNMQANDVRVVSNFIMQALRGQPITLFGDGQQIRSFCFVSDLIDDLVRFMELPPEIVGPINLGNPKEFTTRELAEEVLALTVSSSTLTYRPLPPPDDPSQRKPEISNAQTLLGWAPAVTIHDGLSRTVDHFRRFE
jgi:UDP-glucuronate decarboxylase